MLQDRCPECFHRWSSYSELATRNCSTCGYDVKFSSTLTNESHHPGYQALALVEQIVGVRAKQLLSRAIIGRPRVKHPYFVQEPYRLAIEAESPMVFAVMKELGLITPDELKLLGHITEIEFPEMQSISCELKPVNYDQVFKLTDDDSSQERMLLEKFFGQTLLERLENDNNKLDELDTYITDDGIGVEHLPWMLYMIALGKDDLFLQSDHAQCWELLQLASALCTRYLEHSVVLNPNLEKLVMIENCDESSKQSCIKLPGNVLLVLIHAELTSLIDNIILNVQTLQDKKIINWELFRDKTEEIITKVAGADFPVAFIKRGKQLDVIVPKSLEYKHRRLWN